MTVAHKWTYYVIMISDFKVYVPKEKWNQNNKDTFVCSWLSQNPYDEQMYKNNFLYM